MPARRWGKTAPPPSIARRRCDQPFSSGNWAQRLRHIETQLAAIDAALRDIIEADAGLAARFAIFASIPGIGETTAIALLVEMPELGSLDQRQAASLADLAPVARDSGQWRGKRCIRGGRGSLRQALYMPALVATRFNPDFKQKDQALVAAGKPAKVVITAIMRKLLLLAKTHSSETVARGCKNPLDQNGYSCGRGPSFHISAYSTNIPALSSVYMPLVI